MTTEGVCGLSIGQHPPFPQIIHFPHADVLEHFVPGFRRTDFVDVITNSAWPE